MGQQFIKAWQAAEQGKDLDAYEGVGFEHLEDLLTTLTPKRWALLRFLRSRGPLTVYGLTKALHRNYKNVHTDVKALVDLGLIRRTDDDRVEVPWDEIRLQIPLLASSEAA